MLVYAFYKTNNQLNIPKIEQAVTRHMPLKYTAHSVLHGLVRQMDRQVSYSMPFWGMKNHLNLYYLLFGHPYLLLLLEINHIEKFLEPHL